MVLAALATTISCALTLAAQSGNKDALAGRSSLNQAGANSHKLDHSARKRVLNNYGNLPLAFEPNGGQAGADATFVSRGAGYSVLLAGDHATLSLLGTATSKARGSKVDKRNSTVENATLQLVGANPNAPVSGVDELPGKTNYFIGSDPAKWRTSVPNFAKVKYENVYPGVDLVYYGNHGRLEYDFVVAPGADPNKIRLALDSSAAPGSSTRITRHGDLAVKAGRSEVRFQKPLIYQLRPDVVGADGTPARRIVAGGYRLTGREVRFEVARYDRRKPLVIDPTLVYSTYFGPVSSVASIAVDASGDVYLTGGVDGSLPVKPGAFQTSPQGGLDAFVSKLNSTGTALVYSTYLGGSSYDNGAAIVVGGKGDAFVTGSTSSENFPNTPGAFDNVYPGGNQAGFVTELNPSGSGLVYSTYLGPDTVLTGIALGAPGEAYVTGSTGSTSYPTTPGAYQTACKSCTGTLTNAVVSKMNLTGTKLIYSSYLGGSANDYGNGIAVDPTGSAYLTGGTTSSDFPITPGAFQSTNAGIFVSKFDPTGSILDYSTFLGGSATQYSLSVAVDAGGEAFVVGQTTSSDFPVTSGAFEVSCGNACSQGTAFVTKFNTAGSALSYSTYLGVYSSAASIALDPQGDAYVTGRTSSRNFHTTADAYQRSCYCGAYRGHLYDAVFVSELDPTGSSLLYSTYLSGYYDNDDGFGITVFQNTGDIYVTGITGAIRFPITKGAFETGRESNFVSRIGPSPNVELFPGSLNFSQRGVGTTSPPQTVQLINLGNRSLGIESFSITGTDSGDFAETNTCGGSVLPGDRCDISVTFTPLAPGTRTAQVSVADDAPKSPQLIYLSGSAVGSAGTIGLAPAHLTYASQLVFTTSALQVVTVTNTGTVAVTMSDISTGGTDGNDFSETNNCPSTLNPGATCTVNVSFTPQASGERTGSLFVSDSAQHSPQAVTLSGLGYALFLNPGSLTFESQAVGTSSPPQTVTVTNKASSGSVTLTSLSFSDADPKDFSATTNCGSIITAGEVCSISVTFTPQATGSRTADMNVNIAGHGNPPPVPVSGTGT